jgi:predicted amidohydrolase YtcJ
MVTLGKADLILVNGQFHTVDRENPVAEAVAVRDGKFLEVGTVAEVMHTTATAPKWWISKATPPSPA